MRRVVIVGAGPAGMAAAVEAARWDLDVTVVDEQLRPGGQIFRQPPPRWSIPPFGSGRTAEAGTRLLEQFARLAPQIRHLGDTLVWGAFQGGRLAIARADRIDEIAADQVILAVGATERPHAVQGWTLPGAYLAGGAQALVKTQGVLPGRRVLVAGAGPMQWAAALTLIEAGAEVVAVADVNSRRDWVGFLTTAIAHQGMLADTLRIWRGLRRAGVRLLFRHVLTRIVGTSSVEGAVVAACDAAGRPLPGSELTVEGDAVLLGYGLVPAIELAAQIGCRIDYDPTTGTWLLGRDVDLQTSVPGIFAAGDGARIGGALPAIAEGRLAALAVAALPHSPAALRALDRARAELRRFDDIRRSLAHLLRARPGFVPFIHDDTPVCRCEEVTAGQIRAAIRNGATGLDRLKKWTRAGMGPCQGRMCEASVLAFVSAETALPASALQPLHRRPPARPIPLASLARGAQG